MSDVPEPNLSGTGLGERAKWIVFAAPMPFRTWGFGTSRLPLGERRAASAALRRLRSLLDNAPHTLG